MDQLNQPPITSHNLKCNGTAVELGELTTTVYVSVKSKVLRHRMGMKILIAIFVLTQER